MNKILLASILAICLMIGIGSVCAIELHLNKSSDTLEDQILNSCLGGDSDVQYYIYCINGCFDFDLPYFPYFSDLSVFHSAFYNNFDLLNMPFFAKFQICP